MDIKLHVGIMAKHLFQPKFLPDGPNSFCFFPSTKSGVKWMYSPFSSQPVNCLVYGSSLPGRVGGETKTSAWKCLKRCLQRQNKNDNICVKNSEMINLGQNWQAAEKIFLRDTFWVLHVCNFHALASCTEWCSSNSLELILIHFWKKIFFLWLQTDK